MESLRGIFSHTNQQPPKRDFLKENVMRIKNIQRMRNKSKNTSEYSNKYTRPSGPSVAAKLPSKYNENAHPVHRSTTNLALCSSKAPMTNLRKSLSTMSISSRDFGCQTVDPEEDEFFLKDSIIRYPSASTIRSGSGVNQVPITTCSRGHISEPEERPRFKSHFHDRRDEHCDKMERHISNLSEYLDKGSINKHNQSQQSRKPTSILKTSSSLQKLNKNSINEFQQQQLEEKKQTRVGSALRNAKISTVSISDDENESEEEEYDRNERGDGDSKYKELKKQQQLKAAADDPECPDGHIPLTEDERLEALKLAKKRKLKILNIAFQYLLTFASFLVGFKDFVDELNRLPMTSETLRVRNRKIEIEKELRSLELNIRVFSRPKVYVKLE